MTAEAKATPQYPEGVPAENFSRGLYSVEIPELGEAERGKVRDMWRRDGKLVLVTTDRVSAYDRVVATTPQKGAVLNLTSAHWFEQTGHIVANHVLEIPHSNVLIATEAAETLPVEVVLRRYMAKSSTSTSVYSNYFGNPEKGIEARRRIYGVEFPEGLTANQEFPMGTVITPTTKSKDGHDEELTDEQARGIVDDIFGSGFWRQTKIAALKLFDFAYKELEKKGLILADTKFKFGVDAVGRLMLIDELFTPDSSHLWLSSSYRERFSKDEDPENLDKEILRKWLALQGFTGDGPIPVVEPTVIDQMMTSYTLAYMMMTGDLAMVEVTPEELQAQIKEAVLNAL